MAKFRELFPEYSSFIIFVFYMAFCVGQGIFVTVSRKGGQNYDYNISTVVLFTEIVKLVLAVVCYCKDHTAASLVQSIRLNVRVLCLYLVPSFLYCIYNNLAFVNLSTFDPTTYFILLQLRVVVTGVVFQVIFSKQLSCKQWFSLLFLTTGCIVQQLRLDQVTAWFDVSSQISTPAAAGAATPDSFWTLSASLLLIFVQVLCSCFAGVYNEYLLKGEGAKVNVFVQNVFMYLDSIMWNLLVLTQQGKLGSLVEQQSWAAVLQPVVLLVIFNNALIGITTSLFLKNLNSIVKTFASALELVFTALLSWVFLNIDIHLNTVLAIAIVCYSVVLYSQNPVDNRPKTALEPDQKRLVQV